MMLPALSLRRRLALIICPELLLQKQAVEGRHEFELAERAEHIIRLGNLMLAATGARDFFEANGIKRRRAGRRDNPPATEEYQCTLFLQSDWRAFAKRPSARVSERVYARFITAFSDLWPSDLEWPRDIPRPATKRRVA